MLDLPTALATRAVVLSVMAVVFATAWASERRCVFWRNWLLSSVVDAIGLFMLMIGLGDGVAQVTELGQILMVAGMGFSWQAARPEGWLPLPLLARACLWRFHRHELFRGLQPRDASWGR